MNSASSKSIGHGLTVDQRSLIDFFAPAKSIKLKPSIHSRSILAGNHVSRFRGRGMDFAESRTYQPGDDVRRIDWRVTARTGETYTKIFIEERERPVLICVDFSSSLFFGTRNCLKSVTACNTAAILAWATVHQGDRVGGILSGLEGIQDFKPRAGRRGALKLIHGLTVAANKLPQPGAPSVDCLRSALQHLNQVAHPGSLLVILSDFYGLDEQAESLIGRLRLHNDLMLIELSDPMEQQAPRPGRYGITDGIRTSVISTHAKSDRLKYASAYNQKLDRLTRLCSKNQMPLLNVSTVDSPLAALQESLMGIANRQVTGR